MNLWIIVSNTITLIPKIKTTVYRWLTLLGTAGTAHRSSGWPGLFSRWPSKASVRNQEEIKDKQEAGRDLGI